MNLAGKTCLITGGNSGLGLATAKQFAKLGADVVLLCRDLQKGKKAIEEVRKEGCGAKLELMICDLASFRSIGKFVHEFKKTHSKLDLLFNNAAVLKQQCAVTEDGLETMFQTNFLAPVIFITSFLDLLKVSSPSRIINIALPPEKTRIDFEDLQSLKQYKPFEDFMRTKLYLLLYSLEISQRLAGTGIVVNSINPGLFKSGLRRESAWLFAKAMDWFAVSAGKAAENIVLQAVSVEDQANSGKIFDRKKEKPLIPYWEDPEIRKRLWSVTESLMDQYTQTMLV